MTFAAAHSVVLGLSRKSGEVRVESAKRGRSQPVDATRSQLAINNDDSLPNARPNAFSESLRNQLFHNVIFSAALVPPRNH